MTLPGRTSTGIDYRYGFQGQEKDDELKGEGNSLNYTFRMHDPRVGRFFATDPLESKYPWYTPYQFSGNRVIDRNELEGLEEGPTKAQLDALTSGPKIDMKLAPESSGVNARGFARNGPWFWRQMLEKFPDMFDKSNRWKIENNFSPTANDKWIEYNPSHAAFKNDKLIHHHVDQGRFAVGLPEKAHRSFFKALHNRSAQWFKANKVKSRATGFFGIFTSLGDAFRVLAKHPDALLSTFDPNAPLNTCRGLTPSDPAQYIMNGNYYYEIKKKNSNGSYEVDFYSDFERKGDKYIGVNKVDSGIITKAYDGGYNVYSKKEYEQKQRSMI